MTTLAMRDLPRNARFVAADKVEYVVSIPAAEHSHGFVGVIDWKAGTGGFFDNTTQQVQVTFLPDGAR